MSCVNSLQVIKELVGAGSKFRVLALSATPGNDLKVQCMSMLTNAYSVQCITSSLGAVIMVDTCMYRVCVPISV